ncbi:hypothetical protein BRADI_1g38117v3 [Brachypodium distachyon]|uniref:Uncharacterized protein n=1 Tax=Brachypodium distachyon TaxID=15368 RepID=A0A2K2DNG2_BRADI|nr:hypothetical protein BRADI_1g38117v3 [Brachypodium distachyon]
METISHLLLGCITDLRTAIILFFWTIWRHRNDVVFNGAVPSVAKILQCIREELGRWKHAGTAGARGSYKGRVRVD